MVLENQERMLDNDINKLICESVQLDQAELELDKKYVVVGGWVV